MSDSASPGPARGGPDEFDRLLSFDMQRQPNDETCGPTCLHAVYSFWGVSFPLDQVVTSVLALSDEAIGRGTLAVNLGIDALERGFAATLYTFNLNVFDPTWFDRAGVIAPEVLEAKLMAQAEAKSDEGPKFRAATRSYLRFSQLGGGSGWRT